VLGREFDVGLLPAAITLGRYSTRVIGIKLLVIRGGYFDWRHGEKA
jgi:hypothetical protein